MTQADQPLRLRTPSPADEADRAVLVRLADGELDALEDLYDRYTLAIQDLAPTAGDIVYEAWVIGSDGVPVPVGSFKVGATGIASFEGRGLPAADGTILALTLEPGPDAKTPTMPIISKGVATAPG